jgi:hypothetical protein
MPLPGIERVVQPVAIQFTDLAIPIHNIKIDIREVGCDT